jgi:hypothetical protein
LEEAASALGSVATEVSIRGDNAAQFFVATARGRTIELSKSNVGIWVEFWDVNAVMPNHDSTYATYELAARFASEWLSTESDDT